MKNESDYPLTIEILEDSPEGAGLIKGQICKAMIDPDDPEGFCVFNTDNPSWWWLIDIEQAKVIDNG